MIDGKTANEIFDSIRQHIIAGTLRAEDSLPPVRELASELKVNRNTVAAADNGGTGAKFRPQWDGD